jgi:MFS family permease
MGRYLVAAFAARLADAMWIGPVLLVLDRTGSAGLAGLTMSAATLPTLVTAPLIGAWLDVHGRRRAAIAVNQIVVAGALAGLAFAAGAAPPAVLVGCAGLAGLTQPLVTGGFSSMVPGLAADRARGAALDSMTYSVASVAGPGLAALVAAAAGPAAAVLGQAGVALAALGALLSLPAGVDARSGDAPRLVAALARGLGHLVRVPDLRAVTLTTVLEQLPAGLLSVVAPALAVALGARRADGGWILAAVAVGAAAGAPLLPALRVRCGLLGLVLAGTLAQGAGLALLGVAPGLPLALAAAALAGAPQGLAIAALFAARGDWSPPELRAQVFTSAAGLRTGVFAIGAALAGPALTMGARGATALAAATCAVAALAGLAVRGRGAAGALAGAGERLAG